MAIPNQRILTTIDSVASSPRDSSARVACIESFYSVRPADARRPASRPLEIPDAGALRAEDARGKPAPGSRPRVPIDRDGQR